MAQRILSISYDPSLLRTRQELLESQGYSVVSAEGFTAGLANCRGQKFDLVVMGHSIPQQDKEALLKAVTESCAAPVLELSRLTEPPLKGAAASVDPHSPRDFLSAVERILRKNPKQLI